MRLAILIAAALATTGCNHVAANLPGVDEELRHLEERSGGRLGAILLDDRGRAIFAYRADERFAFCSTFKLALTGALLDAARAGKLNLEQQVSYRRDALKFHSPVLEDMLQGSDVGTVSLREAAKAAMTVSDNSAANIVIDALGGPAGVTAAWRTWGDGITRLDRRETDLNENGRGDPRDTSSPRAMATTIARLIGAASAGDEAASALRAWSAESTTGRSRVRAGLPADWPAGDKTGTCSGDRADNAEVNDIGWVEAPDGRMGWFAVMVDRPDMTNAEAEALHAEIGRLIARTMTR